MFFTTTLHQLLLPPQCLLCGLLASRHNLCQSCLQDLPILTHNCVKCAQILPLGATSDLCGSCLAKPPYFDRIFALFPYASPIMQMIKSLKFRHQLAYASLFGSLLAEAATQHWYKSTPLPDLLLPIPLHPKRLSERGFNQALEIGKTAAKRLHIPIDRSGATRSKHTVAQSGLSASQRKKNIAGAFELKCDYSGLSIAVIDDVITTGQTISEFCLLLHKQGVKQIDVWCCARA